MAPVNGPDELWASPQLRAAPCSPPTATRRSGPRHARRGRSHHPADGAPARRSPALPADALPFTGTVVLELGSGAAGPVATRFFAEWGAAVIRIESARRPDFLRAYGGAGPHGLDGAPMFDSLNPGKASVTIDLKHPDGRDLLLRLVAACDAVSENFAPKALRNLELTFDVLRQVRPGLVMLSACLNGQTGPQRDYPGFGSQGAALSGYTLLTGWPDRPPVGPYGTITDSLAPRVGAAALAAGLHHARRTGDAVHLDLSQVEAAVWSLAPWLARAARTGAGTGRLGNASTTMAPHGVYRASAPTVGWRSPPGATPRGAASPTPRSSRPPDGTTSPTVWPTATPSMPSWRRGRRDARPTPSPTSCRPSASRTTAVADLGDAHDGAQLAARHHLEHLEHPLLGPGDYERNSARITGRTSGYGSAGPLLGADTDRVLTDLAGVSGPELEALRAAAVLR
ncbi:MAG: CoA transferase [Acidimicrobiales bacterium]